MRRTDRGTSLLLGLVFASCVTAGSTRAEEDGSNRIEALERRVAELELARRDESSSQRNARDWTQRVRLGASTAGGYYHHFDDRGVGPEGFAIRDARFFVDAELLDEVPIGDDTLVRNVGFSFEWNLIRLGDMFNNVGDLYVDFQGLGGTPWANAQLGRFQIPVGEEYLRYGRGVADSPFVTNLVGAPWWWDEGVRLYGSAEDGSIGYVASVTSGETPLNGGGGGTQGTLKLYGRPLSWLYLSASGLLQGQLGSSSEPADGALWLGETWARPFGFGTPVESFVDGAGGTPRGPNELDRTWLAAADLVATPLPDVRTWLGWGRYQMDSSGGSFYDRTLSYWVAEVVVGGAALSPRLQQLYLGLRTNRISTGDSGRGYLLDRRYTSTLGYNMESLAEHSAVLGWWLGHNVVLRGQYSLRQIDLVRGVDSAISAEADDEHGLMFDVGVHF